MTLPKMAGTKAQGSKQPTTSSTPPTRVRSHWLLGARGLDTAAPDLGSRHAIHHPGAHEALGPEHEHDDEEHEGPHVLPRDPPNAGMNYADASTTPRTNLPTTAP